MKPVPTITSAIRLLCLALLWACLLPVMLQPANAAPIDDYTLHTYLMRLFIGKGSDSGAYLLERGEDDLMARIWLADHAQETIDVQYFTWSQDSIGMLAADALLRAADRGVKVRVILDDIRVNVDHQMMLAMAAHPNIDIRIYYPDLSVGSSWWRRLFHVIDDYRDANLRMHDRTFIVDGRAAITGGRNMTEEFFDFNNLYGFRDRDVLLFGAVAEDIQASFERFWQYPLTQPVAEVLANEASEAEANRESIYAGLHDSVANSKNYHRTLRDALDKRQEKFPELLGKLVWGKHRFLADRPGKQGSSEESAELLDMLHGARQRITIHSPYLVMPIGGIELYRERIANGVMVSIVTNSLASINELEAFGGYAKQRLDLLSAGFRLYELKPYIGRKRILPDPGSLLKHNPPVFAMHTKSIVIDGDTVFIGAFNIDPHIPGFNTATGVLIRDSRIAGKVEEAIQDDMKEDNSWRVGTDFPDKFAVRGKRIQLYFMKKLPLEPVL